MTLTPKQETQRRALDRREAVDRTIVALVTARDAAKEAGAPRTLARIRLALSSAKGARRNAENRAYRETTPIRRARDAR